MKNFHNFHTLSYILVVLLMLDKGKLQQFMMMASHKNMTNGDYVYIAVHPFATSETFLRNTHSLHNYVWILPWMGYHGKGEGKNAFFFGSKEEMVKAYQGLFVLMPQVMIFKLKFLICIRIY